MQDNKVVIVSGASAGLGKALCEVLVERGYKVGAFARSSSALAELQERLGSENLLGVKTDVASEADANNAVARVVESFGKICAVYNNAALYPKSNILDQSIEEFKSALDVNVAGVVNVLKATVPHIDAAGARIINLGSWAHLGPIADSAVYSASKGAVHSLCKGLAVDLAARNIPVAVLEWVPGHLNTQMSEFTGMDPQIAAGWGADLIERDLGDKNHAIFEQNWEWQAPKGLKQKIKDKLLFWKK